MILDYFRTAPAAALAKTPRGLLRTFYSHRARLELARSASVGQALLLLAALSLAAALLEASHARLHPLLASLLDPRPGVSLAAEFAAAATAAAKTVLTFAPVCFGLLAAFATGLALLWTRRHAARPWSRCFPAASVGCVPLLWFFLLLQLEVFAPFFSTPVLPAPAAWNPFTNHLRFASLLLGLPLLGLWLLDAARLYHSLTDPA